MIRIKINDTVIVKNQGSTYDTHRKLADEFNISNWQYGKLAPKNKICVVKNIFEAFHRICYIEDINGKGYLVGNEGLEKVGFRFIERDEMML